jgi:hypothetical protein
MIQEGTMAQLYRLHVTTAISTLSSCYWIEGLMSMIQGMNLAMRWQQQQMGAMRASF